MSSAAVVTLMIVLLLPDQEPIEHRERVESLSLCLAMARELLSRAEEGPLRTSGGQFIAGCRIQAPPSIEH